MRNPEPKPATHLAATLASEPGEHSAYRAAIDAEALIRMGNRAQRLALQRCNGVERYDADLRRMRATWTEADEDRANKAAARIRKDAAALLEPYGATDVRIEEEPRGRCLSFRLASGRSNSIDVWEV